MATETIATVRERADGGSTLAAELAEKAVKGGKQPTAELASPAEKLFLYVVLSLVIAGIAYTLVSVSRMTTANYQAGIALARDAYAGNQTSASVSLVYILQLSRAYDAVALKAAALFLGYIIVTIGCMFVLKGVEASYRLRLANATTKSALETSSPGLVLITLGSALVAITILVQSTNTIQVDSAAPAPRAADTQKGYNAYAAEPLP